MLAPTQRSAYGTPADISDGRSRRVDRIAVCVADLCPRPRAPAVWGVGRQPDGRNPWASIEPRISANLSNQFEWPLLFYVACVLLMQQADPGPFALLLAWLFVGGRVVHSGVQIFTRNIRLRGLVFTINFLAVLALWAWVLVVRE